MINKIINHKLQIDNNKHEVSPISLENIRKKENITKSEKRMYLKNVRYLVGPILFVYNQSVRLCY